MSDPLILVSHPLCPYVQRAAIALAEKDVAFRRIDIDLSDKPDWFLRISPLGKTPVLRVGDVSLFESHAIVDYLDETRSPRLHPADPLARAEHRGWIAFASALLDDIARLYSAPDEASFEAAGARIAERFRRVEARLGGGPWFEGRRFSLVDAAFAPAFRYLDTFEGLGVDDLLDGAPRVAAWRLALSTRPSVRVAAPPDYPARLRAFLAARNSHLGRRADHRTAA